MSSRLLPHKTIPFSCSSKLFPIRADPHVERGVGRGDKKDRVVSAESVPIQHKLYFLPYHLSQASIRKQTFMAYIYSTNIVKKELQKKIDVSIFWRGFFV